MIVIINKFQKCQKWTIEFFKRDSEGLKLSRRIKIYIFFLKHASKNDVSKFYSDLTKNVHEGPNDAIKADHDQKENINMSEGKVRFNKNPLNHTYIDNDFFMFT